MAFSWILGKRQEATEMASDKATVWIAPPDKEVPDSQTIAPADIKLMIDQGLLVVMGPLGDPLTPSFLKETFAESPDMKLSMADGREVEPSSVVAVLEAQQSGRLADTPDDSWIESMLGLAGGFGAVSPEQLDAELDDGKVLLTDRVRIALQDGETVTLCDAHPGTSVDGPMAALLVDGQPVSVRHFLNGIAGETLAISPDRPFELQCEEGRLRLSDGRETKAAILEKTAEIWDGRAKVDLLLGDGQRMSIGDLVQRMNGHPSPVFFHAAPPRQASYVLQDHLDVDVSQATIVMISKMPDAWRLSHGSKSEDGVWMLEPAAFADASVEITGDAPCALELEIQVISIADHSGKLDRQISKVTMPPGQRRGSSQVLFSRSDSHDVSVKLSFDEAELAQARAADALLLRGLPEKASLSSGAYDAALKGWVLRPHQLDQCVINGIDPRESKLEVMLKAVYFDQNRGARSEIIAQKIIEPRAAGAMDA